MPWLGRTGIPACRFLRAIHRELRETEERRCFLTSPHLVITVKAMKTRIVRIGNSRGIRIPKLLLERSNLAEEVELQAHDNQIIIRSAREPRQGWENVFQAVAARGDDGLLDNDSLRQTRWDVEEWQW